MFSVSPQIDNTLVEQEPEEIAGQIWVLFVCSLSANKQVTTFNRIHILNRIIG